MTGLPWRRLRNDSALGPDRYVASSESGAQITGTPIIEYGCSSHCDGRNDSRYTSSAWAVPPDAKWWANENGRPSTPGGVRAVVAGAEQPDRRPVAVGGGGDDLRVRAAEVGEQVAELRREFVAGLAGVAAQGGGGDPVGARRAAEAEVDAAGMERLERAELFGHGERGVVGQHHAAGTDPQRGGGVGEVGDQHGR